MKPYIFVPAILALAMFSSLPGAFSTEADTEGGEGSRKSSTLRVGKFGKSGRSFHSCTKRLLDDCRRVRREVRRGYSLPSSIRCRGGTLHYLELCRDLCNVRISRTFSVQSKKDGGVGSNGKPDNFDFEKASDMEPNDLSRLLSLDEEGIRDAKVVVMVINVKGGEKPQVLDRSSGSKSGNSNKSDDVWENSRGLRGSCQSALDGNRPVSRSFARRCAKHYAHDMQSFKIEDNVQVDTAKERR